MARGRMLNKSISGSVKFHNLSDDTCRLLATWIIAHLDMRGVFYGDPAMVRSVVFPRRTDVTIEQVERYLCEMESAGLMWRFRCKGDVWQMWPGFTGEQAGMRADRESSPFPTPPDAQPEQERTLTGNLPASIRQSSGNIPPQSKAKEVKEIHGAFAPAIPVTFEQWRDGYRAAENKPGYAGYMLATLYPSYYRGEVKPNYGMLAKLLNGSDPEYFLGLVHKHSADPPVGDPVKFLAGVLKKTNRAAAPSEPARALDPSEVMDPDAFFGSFGGAK